MRTKQTNPLPKTAPGTVCAQMVRCGKQNCKCARGELHGPYYYHFVRIKGVLVKRYVKAKDVAQVRAACQERQVDDLLRRLEHLFNVRELIQAGVQLRGYEKQLSQLGEGSYGQEKEED
jgi:hypothetical protein